MNAQAVLQVTQVNPYAEAEKLFDLLRAFLRCEASWRMTHSDMERELGERGRELLCELYQAWLDQQMPAEADGPVVDAEGQLRSEARTGHKRNLETTFGTVRVHRTGYATPGKPSLHPFDGQLNLPDDKYSLEVRRRVAEEVSKNAFEDVVETLDRHTGAHVPKRQTEQLACRAAQDFNAFYLTRRQEGPGSHEASGALQIITCDGKGVVMHEDDLREATRKAAKQQRHKLDTRLAQGEKKHRKRMATVAAVYTIEPFERTPAQMLQMMARQPVEPALPARPRPEEKRLWASLIQDPREVLEEAFKDALDRDPHGKKRWASVVDGNEKQLAILEELAAHHGRELTLILDIYHVSEYLWKAGHVFHAKGTPELEVWVLERMGRLLRGEVSQVAAGMTRSATKRGLSNKKKRPVIKCAKYLLKYKHYLRYDQYLAAGLPIGSGVVEGGCRHLINDRLGKTGARWRLTDAEAVLRLRALRSSGDFDEYWHFHEAQQYKRTHQARYANGRVPPVNTPKPPTLKIVETT